MQSRKELTVQTQNLDVNNSINQISPINSIGEEANNQSNEYANNPSQVIVKGINYPQQKKATRSVTFKQDENLKMDGGIYQQYNNFPIEFENNQRLDDDSYMQQSFDQEQNSQTRLRDENLQTMGHAADLNNQMKQQIFFGDALHILTIKSGEKVKKMDFIGQSDPYIQFTYRGKTYKTEHISNNQNPIWNQKFSFVLKAADQNKETLSEKLKFYLYDQNSILKDELVGYCDISLEKLITSKGVEQRLKVRQSEDVNELKKEQNLGFIVVQHKFMPLIKSEQAFPEERDYQATFENLGKIGQRRYKGILKLTTHHFEGLEQKDDYEIFYKFTDGSSQSNTPNDGGKSPLQKELKSPMKIEKSPLEVKMVNPQYKIAKKQKQDDQVHQDQHFKVADLFSGMLYIQIVKKKSYLTSDLYANIACNFSQADQILQGDPMSIEIELNRTLSSVIGSQKDSKSGQKGSVISSSEINPKIILTMTYFNSILTKFPKGQLNLTIKSFPTTFYLNLQTKDQPIKIERMRQPVDILIADSLDDFKITVMEKKSVTNSVIAQYTIKPYEFFNNSDQIVFRLILQNFTFIDQKKSQEISLSVAAKFMPDISLVSELDLISKYGQLKESQSNFATPDIDELMKRDSSHYGGGGGGGQEESMDIQEKLKIQQFRNSSNRIDRDLYTFSLQTSKPIVNQDYKRGVLVIRLLNIDDFYWDEIQPSGKDAKIPQFYFVIKTSKICWNEVFEIRITDLNEDIVFKLYRDDVVPQLVAEGKINPTVDYNNYNMWQKYDSLGVLLRLKNKPDEVKTLQYEMMYRYSKFTRGPKGNLEVSLDAGYGLKYNDNSYERPVIKFKLGMQNYQITEDINPHYASWKQKFMNFETSSIWDQIEIRFYGTQSSSEDLILIGAYHKPINSIYYDDESFTQIEIDMSEASPQLGGFLKILFHFYPQRQGFEADLKQNQVLSNHKQKPLVDEQLALQDKKQGVCYLSLKSVEVKGLGAHQSYIIENVRLDIGYQKQSCLSRVTTDLRKTQNKEILNDTFRLVLDDISNAKYDQNRILVKAFDIDYKGNKVNSEIQIFIGQATIDPYIMRQHQGVEIHYQCAIEISEQHFLNKSKKKLQDDSLLMDSVLDELDEVQFLELTDHKSKAQQLNRDNKRELILHFQILYISTAFTKNPFGMIAINDLFLLNLTNYLDISTLTSLGDVFLIFKLNGNKNSTSSAKNISKDALKKEKLCLFHQEYDPIDVMRAGESYCIDTKALDTYFKWEKQLVLFTSHPLDQIEVEVVYQRKQTKMIRDANSKIILANILISIADISYFLERNAGKDVGVANLMDFQGSPEFNPFSWLAIKQSKSRKATEDAMSQQKLQNFMNTKDLSYSAYQNQLILIFDTKFYHDGVIERDPKRPQMLSIDHIFIVPREEKYDNFIADQYESFVNRFQKEKQKLEGNAGSSLKDSVVSNPRGSVVSNQDGKSKYQENNHMLVEFHLINLNSILREVQNMSNKIYCFVAFEYLSSTDSISSYIKQSVKQYKADLMMTAQTNTLRYQGLDPKQQQDQVQQSIPKKPIINPSDQGFTHIVEEMFGPTQELLGLNTQITQIFGVNDFEIHTINKMLEGWVPITTNKIMLSLIVQQNGFQQLDLFRNTLLESVLCRSNTLLGIKFTGKDDRFNQVEVYQTPIDFDLKQSKQSHSNQSISQLSAEPSILKTFYQSANLCEFVVEASNSLLMNPIVRAQCQVRTRLQTSKFIDIPSGYLSVGLRNMTHNNENLPESSYVKLTLRSKINKMMLPVEIQQRSTDTKTTGTMKCYKKVTKKNGKTVVTLNEIVNFVVRHFADCLIISIYHGKSEDQEEPGPDDQLHFQTKVELNNLDLNEDKLTIVVVGTNSMRRRAQPTYYTFELDLHFKPRLINSKIQNDLEMAYENFKLLKGSDKLTKAEEEVLKMLLMRAELAKKLTKQILSLRKCFFMLRNMVKTCYQSFDFGQQVYLRVLPKAFFFSKTHQTKDLPRSKYNELMATISTELAQGRQTGYQSNSLAETKYKGTPLEKNSTIEKSNILIVEFLSNINLGSSFNPNASMLSMRKTPSNLSLGKFASNQTQGGGGGVITNFANKYKKLILVATQNETTIAKEVYDKYQIINGQLMKGLKIFFNNVQKDNVLSFRLLVEEDNANIQGGTTKKSENGKLVTLGIVSINLNTTELKAWTKKKQNLCFNNHINTEISLNLIYSDFTKNPTKIVNFMFHRLVQILPEDILDKEEQKKAIEQEEQDKIQQQLQNRNNKGGQVQQQQQNPQKGSQQDQLKTGEQQIGDQNPSISKKLLLMLNKKEQQHKLVLSESSVVEKKLHDGLQSTQNLAALTSQRIFEKHMSHVLTNTLSKYNSQQAPKDGSMNDKVNKLINGEGEETQKYKVLIEYENCKEFEGDIMESKIYDVDSRGKKLKPFMDNLTINNTKFDNKIIFKLCIDNSGVQTNNNQNYDANTLNNSLVVLAQTSLYLAEVQTLPNQTLNFFVPLKNIEPSQNDDMAQSWVHKNYELKDVFVLGSIRITDKTFGELAIHLDTFATIPRQLDLISLAYNIYVKPSQMQRERLMMQKLTSKYVKDSKSQTSEQLKAENNLFFFESKRFPYEITASTLKVDREENQQMQMKDIFADRDIFLNPAQFQLYENLDNKLVFELIAYDEHEEQRILGIKEISMLDMIRKQMNNEIDRARAAQFQQSSSKTGEAKNQQLVGFAEKKLQSEFVGTSARFQKLFKDSYVRYNKTKEEIQKQKEEEESKKSRDQNDEDQAEKLIPDDMVVPEGYEVFRLDHAKIPTPEEKLQKVDSKFNSPVKNQKKGDKIQDLQKLQQNEIVTVDTGIRMLVKIEWNFKYKARMNHTDKYKEFNEEIRELERMKQQKNILNLIETLDQVKTKVDLTQKNLRILTSVLATESCLSGQTEEDFQNNQVLKNTDKIIKIMAEMYKYRQLDSGALVQVMKCITYLKITCDCDKKYQNIFREHILKSMLIETMIEHYQTNILRADGTLSQKTLALEFMSFITTIQLDFNEIYFDMISGVRLDPLLAFMSQSNETDFNIVLAYSKFLNSISQCLFNFRPEDYKVDEKKAELKKALVKMDMIKVAKGINKLLVKLLNGTIEVFKNDYERVSEIITQTGVQFIHLSIMQCKLISYEVDFTLPDILLNLFKILVDGIISQLSLDFITELKSRLNYEMSLIKSLGLREQLMLMFDDSILIGMMERLTVHFAQLMKHFDIDKRDHGFRFFDKTKLIFEFFATDYCLNVLAENIRAKASVEKKPNLLQEILSSPSVEDLDFVLFLQRVVKIDAEIESIADGDNREERERRKQFIQDKYGTMTRVNKFSLTRVSWLDTLYNNNL
ncbi:c2 domain-containing protein [Stylonychia lemnae]|uniref:C2 domain-containing protein n=1 Tax=Stylonychia lemnae TaxID=5949 RepID=A0A078B099_STYLE|nr:c2 domain-containing protein [Stylonychia lemnae]|eukprot:CDW88085.1 c2 domain-containing protein [Stylonychia lemnae]